MVPTWSDDVEVQFRSEITVRLIQKMGSDAMPVAAARVSTTGEAALEYADPDRATESDGLIRYLMAHRHGTPSEHSAMTFFVHAPAFVWWEWIRHRVGQSITCPGLSDDMPDASFNLESGRYKKLDPVFWIPRPDRKMIPALDHKPACPKFIHTYSLQYERIVDEMKRGYRAVWGVYETLIANKVANEVARAVLGFGVYYAGWVTCNPRSLMSFLSLRTHDSSATFVSYPQAEIEEAARAAETVLAEGWPITYKAFCDKGRVAP
jgi:thymidylate synthase (FAD)